MNKAIQTMTTAGLFTLVVFFIFLAAPVRAAPPTTLHFQGYLTAPIGTPVNATVDMIFALYDDPVTAGPLWAELQTVTTDNGLFSVVLGTLTPIELAFDTQIYLGITVGTDVELAPRLALGASAKTFRSATAEAVIEGGVIGVMIADGVITPDKLAPVCNVGEVLIMGASGWECGAVPCVAQPEVCDGLDNDCNDLIDDGPNWANKGQPCAAGAGSCAAQGVFICDDTDPAGPTLCSAFPGVPGEEVCDGLDNDCNNLIDDELSASLCSNQTGVCLNSTANCGGSIGFLPCGGQNYGPDYEFVELSCDGLDNDCDGATDEDLPPRACDNQTGVCMGSTQLCGVGGIYLACTAANYGPTYQPDEFVCDGLDNDCDGFVDEGFLNPGSGQYDSQDACGSCGNSCTGQFPNAEGFCDASGAPVCAFTCTPGFHNLNSNPFDGCEFGADSDGIYASTTNGTDAPGCGVSPLTPCATIVFATSEAQGQGRSTVYVADGVYQGVTLVNGLSLRGGYRPDTWERHIETTQTIIRNDGTDPFTRTVIAEGISVPTVFEGFVVEGRDSQSTGGSSYALWVHDSNSGLVITHNVIVAGDGADGTRGSDGLAGTPGPDGGDGVDTLDLFDAYGVIGHNCTSANHSPGGTGGTMMCGPNATSGGDGGERVCPGFDGATTTPPVPGEGGEAGANGGAAGGVPGRDVYHQAFACEGYVVFDITAGTSGVAGSDGSAGGGAGGCADITGATNLANGLWGSGVAGPGQSGTAAAGGGGGGAGAGSWTHLSCTSAGYGNDNLGGTGGGGGAGGCGGTGGAAGTSGGGSFALFVSFSVSPGSNVPTVSDNVIYRARGGDGGDGGFGGIGAPGGAGGSGGAGVPATPGVPNTLYPGFPGGAGGAGGDGGHGGGGGGGCGGPSYGIFFAAGSVPSEIDTWKIDNLFPASGAGGAGGPGGGALINPGSDGAVGAGGETNY